MITNPNSPNSTWVSSTDLSISIEPVPKEIMAVIDEAYTELMQDAAYESMAPLVKEHPNLIIVRTFSKDMEIVLEVSNDILN